VGLSAAKSHVNIREMPRISSVWKVLLKLMHIGPHGGHSPGKPGKVREFKSGQGKVRENVFLHARNLANFLLRKIIEIVATRCQILRLKCTKFDPP